VSIIGAKPPPATAGTEPQAAGGAGLAPETSPMPSLAGLPRRYSALTALGLAPILLIVGLLVLWQFHEQRNAMLMGLGRTAVSQRLALTAALAPTRDYVERLRRAAEARLGEGSRGAPSPLRAQLAALKDATPGIVVGTFLDGGAADSASARSGTLVGGADLLSGERPDPAEIDTALDLMEQMWLAHAGATHLLRSYYVSAHGDLVGIYPGVDGRQLIAERGLAEPGPWLRGWLDDDIVTGALPAANPGREPFWTQPHVEGSTWTVSHGAPVYDGDRFAGVVGADLSLSLLGELVAGSTLALGQVWVVDAQGRAVAGPGVPPPGAERAPALAQVLTTTAAAKPVEELLRDAPGFRRLGEDWVMAQAIAASPWRMLWVVPAAELQASLLPRLLPSALILAGVALTLVLAQWLLQRLFVRPALALVDHVRAESHNRAKALPPLPVMWRTLADGVTEAFAARRELSMVSRRFEAAAESLLDGLAIWDEDDRLVYYNRRYPQLVLPSLAAALRLGVRFEDWLHEALASGPIYHPDMGEDFLARRMAYRNQELSDHEQHLADGRWVRLRESRMPDGGRVLLISDVTARHAQADALVEQTRKLEAVLANIAEGVMLLDPQGRLMLVNDGFMWLYGFPPELAKPGTPIADFVRHRLRRGDLRYDEDPAEVAADLERAVQRRVEQLLTTPSGSYELRRPDGRVVQVERRRLPDGLLVSTFTDVTESRQHERELAMLATAIDQVGDSVEIATPDYELVYVNPAFTRLTGYTAQEAIGRKPGELLRSGHHDDAFFDEIDRVTRAGATWKGRLISRHKHGHDLIQDATISPLHDETGKLIHRVAVKRDVSERERALEALRDSEERYRGVVEAQTEFIIRQRPDGTITFTNEAFCRHRGLPRERMLKDYNDLASLPAAARDTVLREWAALTPERPTTSYDLRLDQPDGSARYEQWTDRAVFDPHGRLIEYQSVGRDITEQRRAEAALRASERLKEAVLEAALDCVVGMDEAGRIVEFNPAAERTFGWSRGEAMGRDMAELLVPPALREAHRSSVRRHLATGEIRVLGKRLQLPALHADGREFPIELVIVAAPGGQSARFVAYMRDITEQRRAEAALRESEERYRGVVEAQTEFIIRQTPDGRLTFANDAYCRYRGKTRDELLDPGWDDLADLRPEDRAAILAAWAKLAQGSPPQTTEVRPILADGSERVELWTDRGIFAEDGSLIEIQSVGRDITGERQAEAALKASEERFRTIVEDQAEFISRFRPDFTFTFLNQAYARQLGRDREALLGTSVLALMTPEQQELFRAQLAALTPSQPTCAYEMDSAGPDGSRRIELWTDRALFDGEGRLVEYQSVGRDVTAQKQAEAALRESEERYRAVVQDQTEVIGRFDADFRRTFANEADCRLFGKPLDELLGQSFFDTVPPALVEELRARLLALTPDHPVDVGENEKILPDGSVRWFAWTNRALFDSQGRTTGYQSVGRDITEERQTEQALRESEAAMRAIAEGVPLPLAIAEMGRPEVLFINARAAETFGLALGHQPERLAGAWVDPEGPSRLAAMVAAEGSVDGFETRMRRVDGSLAWVLLSARRILFRGRSAYLAVLTDITERRGMEEALRASEARLAGFLENAPVGMYLKSVDGRYLMANPEMGKVFGRPAETMIGLSAADVLSEDAATMVRGYDREVIEGGRPTVHEEYLEGVAAYAWTMVIRFPVRDAGGIITHIGGFDVDITAQKGAERALKESEQRFRQFAEAHPVPLMVLRLEDSRVLFVNPAYLSLLQLTAEQLDRLDRHELWVDPAERLAYLDRLRRDGEIQGYEVVLRRQDGLEFPASMSSRLIEYAGEKALVTSVIDLSRQKEAESEIQRQREALHQSEKLAALGSLLAGVAHELNNPLSVVVGYSSMLEEFAPDEQSRRRAERVHAAADRCARIVKAFLAMARQKPPKFGPVALNHVIEAALELAAYGLRTADIEVVRDLDPDLPAVWGDSDQLHQVLANLIVNGQHALEHMDGPRRLVLRSARRDGAIEVGVEDNGPGMPEDVRKRIFEPFFTTKPQGMGVGVGLSLCHGIISGHGGHIDVETAPGQGSRFVVTLPLSLREVANGEPAMIEPSPAGRGRVLVVDDEAELGDLVREILSREGYEVSLARSGREALTMLDAGPVDVIVSDLRMPDLDGPGLWRELQARRPELAGRMIFVTGDTLGADASRFLKEAQVPVMEKPLDLAELRRRVAEVAERGGAQVG
jgi:PAS domain S-box-containing protein